MEICAKAHVEKLRNTLYSVQKMNLTEFRWKNRIWELKAMEFEKNNETDLGHETRSSLGYD